MDAKTDQTIQGIRTTHDIDVLVKSHYAGFDIIWLIEGKYWKARVNKLHVLALREIVTDVGADRGILLSENGFQSGAIEASRLTNVLVTSIDEMKESASSSIYAMRLLDLLDRLVVCKKKYWDISKEDRIKHGLRPDTYEVGYSGDQIMELCNDLLTQAHRGIFPFQSDTLYALVYFGKDRYFQSTREIVELVEEMISGLEDKIQKCIGNK